MTQFWCRITANIHSHPQVVKCPSIPNPQPLVTVGEKLPILVLLVSDLVFPASLYTKYFYGPLDVLATITLRAELYSIKWTAPNLFDCYQLGGCRVNLMFLRSLIVLVAQHWLSC